ncbi:MAG: glycolate oxidase iron-sulfur subunit [Cycloclasticus sp. symbiont of Bathymodiolus heckerae]|nr:MAG: glycolate oxidase iron-sulfur subunit [Cycloclasticus sp. symbiont of Bathymodiolus heckerae]
MCPANVPYSRLVNDFRAETSAAASDTPLNIFTQKALNNLTGKKRQTLNTLVRLAQSTGAIKLSARATQYLPKKLSANNFKTENPSLAAKKIGHVAFFTGCASEAFDATTLKSAIFLLRHCGFDVSIPKTQVCCGAIDLHAGKHQRYKELSDQNIAVFSDKKYDAVISVASGCGSTVADYDSNIASLIVDISDIIAPYLATLTFKPLDASAWLHIPCTLKNTLHGSKGTNISDALNHIKGLNIHTFDANQHCCGAAGTYMLTHEETANTLRTQVLSAMKKNTAHYLLTSNIGCAMHLRSGLKQAGVNTEVLHPVSLLAQQLKV